jgi:uncharacterized membrane protein YphA (DoxX/SURF4 family)
MNLLITLTLTKLCVYIALAALPLSLVIVMMRKHKSIPITYLQNFTGLLFIFSGGVKAIDPLGTAYKMEQYFAEFKNVFEPTFLKGISPLFPLLSEYSIGFSVVMIIFEILLGWALVVGSRPKLTAWLFLLLVLFFTALTGFTYLTGYVQPNGTFFDFATWGAYAESNMKVTDCGCFGDFLKLKPMVSFFKDIALLIPAFLFVFKSKQMHQLGTSAFRTWTIGLFTLSLSYFCISNYVLDLPIVDFRPFRIGADVGAQYKMEKDAANAVQVVSLDLKNKKTGELKTVAYAEYMKNWKDYPAEVYETVNQNKTESTVAHTKISDFLIKDFKGDEVTNVYLDNPKNHFMIVSHESKYTTNKEMKMIKDTVYVIDSIYKEMKKVIDTSYVTRIDTVLNKEIEVTNYIFDKKYFEDFNGKMKVFMSQAIEDGQEVSIVFGGLTKEAAQSFKSQLGLNVSIYEADNILLKTIVRSNPGPVLWKDGKIIYKWHKSKLPLYEEVKLKYIK